MNHEFYMQKCIKLAKKGEGRVSPNPLVGAIVLDDKGNMVGEGFHEKYGEAHAEVNALKQAGEKAYGGTLYITLEPCSHYGKTPPCADLVIEKGIKRLIIGMKDPNPLVAGRGLEKCKNAGIEVIEGVLEDECKKLNEVFIKDMTEKKPFIAIKSAITLDGKIATKTGSSKWITGENAREEVQNLRNKYDAILTSSSTVISDNPSLTCRKEGGRNPIRVIVDSNLKTPKTSNVYNNDGTKVFLASLREAEDYNAENIICREKDGRIDLVDLTQKLYERGIKSILIECGGTLSGSFIKENLADKLYLFIAPKILGDKEACSFVMGFDVSQINECKNLSISSVKHFSPDIMIEAYF